MANIIVLFSKHEDAINVRNLLTRYGYTVQAVCTSGAQALSQAEDLNDGVVVCGYKYKDMLYSQLQSLLPPHFEMLLIASQRVLDECMGSSIMCVVQPLKVRELCDTLEMMVNHIELRRRRARSKPKERSEEDKELIKKAKQLLMERNHMTEEEAHRYMQKCSMDSGTNLVETAQMVMSMINM